MAIVEGKMKIRSVLPSVLWHRVVWLEFTDIS
jgi:hypothetical protein